MKSKHVCKYCGTKTRNSEICWNCKEKLILVKKMKKMLSKLK